MLHGCIMYFSFELKQKVKDNKDLWRFNSSEIPLFYEISKALSAIISK